VVKRKADCTAEEWEAHLQRSRDYRASHYKRKEKLDAYNAAVRDRRERNKTENPDQHARDKARSKAFCASPKGQEIDPKRNQDPVRKLALRLRPYGLSVSDFNDLLARQGNACGVCRSPLPPNEYQRNVDHCHETGLVRGVLCPSCNRIEGSIRRRGLTPLEFAQRLQAYLDNPPAQEEQLW
jgi:hypothetical protein